MFKCFLEIANLLNKDFQVVPVLYGSFSLKRLLDADFHCDDIDFLVPNELITVRWEKFLKAITSKGFVLTDLQEREFVRGYYKIAFAQEEELLSFCGLDAKLFKEEHNNIASFRTPTLADFLLIYQQSLLDGYRSNKGKKDQEKLDLILKRRDDR